MYDVHLYTIYIFILLQQALLTEDIEVKATVSQFVNSMILGM